MQRDKALLSRRRIYVKRYVNERSRAPGVTVAEAVKELSSELYLTTKTLYNDLKSPDEPGTKTV